MTGDGCLLPHGYQENSSISALESPDEWNATTANETIPTSVNDNELIGITGNHFFSKWTKINLLVLEIGEFAAAV